MKFRHVRALAGICLLSGVGIFFTACAFVPLPYHSQHGVSVHENSIVYENLTPHRVYQNNSHRTHVDASVTNHQNINVSLGAAENVSRMVVVEQKKRVFRYEILSHERRFYDGSIPELDVVTYHPFIVRDCSSAIQVVDAINFRSVQMTGCR
jgi:hypothetical protein